MHPTLALASAPFSNVKLGRYEGLSCDTWPFEISRLYENSYKNQMFISLSRVLSILTK